MKRVMAVCSITWLAETTIQPFSSLHKAAAIAQLLSSFLLQWAMSQYCFNSKVKNWGFYDLSY